ncbi:MAG: DUF1684 domain-containing protein [Bacteroidota bacterium]
MLLRTLSLLLLAGMFLAASSSDRKYIREVKKHRKQVHKEFSDPAQSPFREKATTEYRGLSYFSPNPAYRVKVEIELTEDAKPFLIPTSNPDRKKQYVSYAILHFELAGEPFALHAYRSLKLVHMPQYARTLFVPFTDLTTGEASYGGGRYMDLEIPEDGVPLYIDFNLAYNPYCAYSTGWSCPIPPEENFLQTRIEAGVKDYAGDAH